MCLRTCYSDRDAAASFLTKSDAGALRPSIQQSTGLPNLTPIICMHIHSASASHVAGVHEGLGC